MATELELRFRIDAGVLARLADASTVPGWRLGPSVTHVLDSTYFDLQDRSLGRCGIGVRIRADGVARTLTVKIGSDANATLGARREWNLRTAGDVPDLRKLRRYLPAEAMAGPLVPVFRTEVRRIVRVLSGPARARGELALDEGVIRAGRRRARIRELELELKAGRPRALHDLALALHRGFGPFILEPSTKSARGYAMATGTAQAPRRADDIGLATELSGEAAAKTILRSCLAQIVANQAAALEGADSEGVHQMRIGVRRFRAALSCLRRLLPTAARRAISAEFRWLGRELGDAREWDVLIAETLTPAMADPATAVTVTAHLDRAERRRAVGYRRARRALRSPRYTAAVLGALAWLEQPWADGAGRNRGRRLAKPFVRVAWRVMRDADRELRHDRAAVEDGDPARLHAVRIAAKRARYVTEFLAALAPLAAVESYVKALKRVQDAFGHSNDAARAQAMLRSLLDEGAGSGGSEAPIDAIVHPDGGAHTRRRMAESWRRFEATMPVHEAMGHGR
ncbi:MAG: CHAD domain-containing protein [Alphaproteobacteria bacterium]